LNVPPPASQRAFGGRGLGFVARAEEETRFVAAVVPVSGVDLLEAFDREAAEWVLDRPGLDLAGPPLATGTLRPYARRAIRFGSRPSSPATYVYAIRFTATTNPDRTSVLVSRPFRVR
jgi:hypothetical protein